MPSECVNIIVHRVLLQRQFKLVLVVGQIPLKMSVTLSTRGGPLALTDKEVQESLLLKFVASQIVRDQLAHSRFLDLSKSCSRQVPLTIPQFIFHQLDKSWIVPIWHFSAKDRK